MKYIDPKIAPTLDGFWKYGNDAVVIIDVRESDEFEEFHLPGSINIPLTTIRLKEFELYSDRKICLICNSGARSKAVAKKLDLLGFDNVHVAKKQLKDLNPKLYTTGVDGRSMLPDWTIDRQFRLTIGIILSVFLVLFFMDYHFSILVPVFLSVGLIVTAVFNRSCLRMVIRLLPWNS